MPHPPAGRRRSPARAVLAGTVLARTVLAGIVLGGIILWGIAGPAAASPGRAQQAAPVSVAITSVSPQFATARATVHVSGRITNSSSASVTGLSVQLRWSESWLSTRDALAQYAAGQLPDYPVPGALRPIRRSLAPGATVRWSISVRVRKLHLTRFGVYPLAAQVIQSTTGAALATSRTFLPYWPPRHGSYARPARLNISWIWPLIDQPHQAACAGLLNNSLAVGLASGGRLAGLLAAGAAHAGQAGLTWVIDPALLANVQTMTTRYTVDPNGRCARGRQVRASRAAIGWLAKLRSATAGQPVMVTPYADVDVAALTRQSLNQDLASAFSLGRAVAGTILHRTFTAAPAAARGAGAAQNLTGFAWPTGGFANYFVLESLAVNGITTAVLNSSTMPPTTPQSFTPSAVTSTPDGETGDMHVLLVDQVLARLLTAANSPDASPGQSFAVRQRFLAETAMIVAEAPNIPRAVVVAPPRRWNPPPGLAGRLLAETAAAPWLRPVSLGRLAAVTSKAGEVARAAPDNSSSAELGSRLLRRVRKLDRRVQLLQSILVRQKAALNAAVPAIESSAWRGGGPAGAQARALLGRVSAYVSGQLGGISIIPARFDTLGGQRGTVPVSILNKLGYAVRVRLGVGLPADRRLTITNPPPVITRPPSQIHTVKLRVNATGLGASIISLRLMSPDRRPLPAPTAHVTIQASRFGTLTLIIIAAALGVFTISSATRAMRRGRTPPQGGGDPAGAEPAAQAAEAAQAGTAASSITGVDPGTARTIGENEQFGGTDNAVRSQAGRRWPNPDPVVGDRDERGPPREADDYARAPGWSDRA